MKTCKHCNQPMDNAKADNVSIHGMFDMHLFWSYEAPSVDALIDKWLEHISKPLPATVGGREVDDMGPTALCPAIVSCGKQEIRRVGKMVHPDFKTRAPRRLEDVEEYRQALLSDPDIPRLLAEQYSTPDPTNDTGRE